MNKVLIVYDSLFGNTKKVAEIVGQTFPSTDKVKMISVKEFNPEDLKSTKLLVVGSPTHGGRPSPETQKFFEKIPEDGLNNIKIATFDTRNSPEDLNAFLKVLMKVLGFAAPRIEKTLHKKGGVKTVPPEGFIVIGREGPLRKGELERARAWAKRIMQKL